MKKNKLLIFILCLVVCASFMLAACDQGTPVYAAISWEDSESYVFDVSLALKTTDSGYSIEHDDKTFANNSEMLADTGIYDQFRPSSISGTMTYDISTSGAVQTFETVQYIECTYLSADLELFEALKTHVDGLQGDDRDIVLESTSSKIVLSSHTQTTVKFKKVFQQTPVSSQTVVKGFYAGRLHFEVNDYTISTVYEANTATVTKTERGQKVIDGEVRTLSTAQYIDAAQLLLYQRSLDQRAAWTQTPSVDVYDATSDRMLTFSFALGLKHR